MRSDIQFLPQPAIDDQTFMYGDTVRLTTANLRHEYQLDVNILRREGRQIYGAVVAAAPKIDLPPQEWEIARGDEVVFREENIAKAVPGAR
ncbi:TPA: hypothetical protein PPN70_004181 [Serratia rubidaea]|uniref:hypothetical protein n=1 Tax=Serratia rubidaea TaxID=61652 RepID=UPI0023B058AE|nr:hypothetical protein [Serratia rubidaea]MDK1703525.1 hypothetical protein [Serratia rubidaea]HDJ1441727.1 hypothetical protein [Serratia rubidaea]HDJ1447340.1 hypothetical protein [Serratia rubidaea]HDJ1460569.1 hypothetical protein [Serratia rubidaea]HDJ2772075.1 hypothetical protein [Serratia rubidaea]